MCHLRNETLPHSMEPCKQVERRSTAHRRRAEKFARQVCHSSLIEAAESADAESLHRHHHSTATKPVQCSARPLATVGSPGQIVVRLAAVVVDCTTVLVALAAVARGIVLAALEWAAWPTQQAVVAVAALPAARHRLRTGAAATVAALDTRRLENQQPIAAAVAAAAIATASLAVAVRPNRQLDSAGMVVVASSDSQRGLHKARSLDPAHTASTCMAEEGMVEERTAEEHTAGGKVRTSRGQPRLPYALRRHRKGQNAGVARLASSDTEAGRLAPWDYRGGAGGTGPLKARSSQAG